MEHCDTIIYANCADSFVLWSLYYKLKISQRVQLYCHCKETCFSTTPLGSWLFFRVSCDLHTCPLWWETVPIGWQRWALHRSLWHAISHLLSLNTIWRDSASSIFPRKTLCLIDLGLSLFSCHFMLRQIQSRLFLTFSILGHLS